MSDFPASSRSRVGKLRPMDQISHITYFCMAFELRIIFTFFNGYILNDYT